MRKLFNEFFYIPKHGKIREKVMIARLAMTVVIMVACLAAISFSAYAYFSYSVTSGSNTIKAASFKTEVQVRITDKEGNVVETISPETSDYRSFMIKGLKVGEVYTVTIEQIKDETAAKTGFVVVTADGCLDTYHTQQLGIDEKADGGKTEQISFELMITDSTTVYLEAHWGTSSSYHDFRDRGDDFYVIHKEKITMIVNGVDPDKDADKSENTTGKTTVAPSTGTTTGTTTGTDSTSTQTPESTTTSFTEITTSAETTATETTEQTQTTTETTETTETTTAPTTTTEASE